MEYASILYKMVFDDRLKIVCKTLLRRVIIILISMHRTNSFTIW